MVRAVTNEENGIAAEENMKILHSMKKIESAFQ